jgi:hypothetical protein
MSASDELRIFQGGASIISMRYLIVLLFMTACNAMPPPATDMEPGDMARIPYRRFDLAMPPDMAECTPLGRQLCGIEINYPHGTCCAPAFCISDDIDSNDQRCCLQSGDGKTGCSGDDDCCPNGGYAGYCGTSGTCCYRSSDGIEHC